MRLSIEDLTEFGRARLEDDYASVSRRDGGKTSRIDFSLGWMALAVRHRLWAYFTAQTKARLEEGKELVV
jgi:uncharacterized protein (DUF2132 family)